MTLVIAGRAREALAPFAAALTAADSGQLAPAPSITVRLAALRTRVFAEAALKDAAAAQKTSAALDMVATSRSDDLNAQTAMHFGRAMLPVAHEDFAGARSHFSQCSREDEVCKWQAQRAAEAGGDQKEAAALRDEILKLYRRSPAHLIIRSQLTQQRTS